MAGRDFSGADLRSMVLDGADLSGAQFTGASLFGATFIAAVQRAFGDDWQRVMAESVAARGATLMRTDMGPVVGFNANGYLGQYLVVYPAQRLVAVRLVRGGAGYDARTDGFLEFQDLVRRLAP